MTSQGGGWEGRKLRGLIVATVVVVLCAGSALTQDRVAPKKIKPGSCLDAGCHDTMTAGKVTHKPVKKKQCDVCHEADEEDEHVFEYPDTSAEMCYGCHKSVTKKKMSVHAPLKKKKFPCSDCHDSHTGGKSLLKAPSKTALCLKCHKMPERSKRLHASRAVNGCTGCHESHAADAPKLLHDSPPKLCNSCHEELAEQIAESPALNVHGPVAVGCATCHDPHEVLAGKGLKRSGAELCTGCHNTMDKTVTAMAANHPMLLKGKACGTCHDPHVGKHKRMLRKTPQQLCLGCHDKDVKSAGGRTVAGLGEILKAGVKDLRLHGPLAQGKCNGCHDPHGNSTPLFMLKAYPGTTYSPYSVEAYSLCFSCHKAELAATAETATATKFRNGKQNLHFLHVNRAKKGRTCGTCHSSHASKFSHFMKTDLPFGDWKLPIGFKETKTGGSCATGCHRELAYDRDKPVVQLQPVSKPVRKPAKKPVEKPAEKPTQKPAKKLPIKDVPRFKAREIAPAGDVKPAPESEKKK